MFVTFAGSPDRVEARLVPESGYELDTFRISGFPRKPTPALLSSLYRAGVAPSACRAILRRRRPDVVFGAGGYVAGPMVLAARTLRIPAALSEADALFGLANKLAAPFARRVYLAYPLDGHEGASTASSADRSRRGRAGCPRAAARAIFSRRPTSRCCSSRCARRCESLNELVVESFAEVGPAILHITGSATTTPCGGG